MEKRYIGGDDTKRGLLGGRASKPRRVGLIVGFAALCGLMMFLAWLGALIGIVILVVIWVATIEQPGGTPWQRRVRNKRWSQALRHGLTAFRPVSHRPPALHAAVMGGTAEPEQARQWSAYRDWPDGVEGFQWILASPNVPGIAWHTPTGEAAWLSVVFPLRGQISGLAGDAKVDARSALFGRLLASVATSSSLARRLQMITRVLPLDTAAHEAWVEQNADEAAPLELLESYKSVVDELAEGNLAQRHYAVVRWPITPKFESVARRLAPGQQGWIRLMGREVDRMWRELDAAGLGPGRALSAAQVGAVLRHLQLPSWPADQAGDINPHMPWVPSDDAFSYTVYKGLNPAGEYEEWFSRTAVVPIKEVETGARDAFWLLPLQTRLSNKLIRTISFQYEGVPQAVARSQAREDLTSDMADVAAARSKGHLADEDLEEGMNAAKARRDDLRPGRGAEGLGWAMHVSVSTRSVAELRDASELIDEAARKAGINRLEWLDSQQAAAAACTWPLARGMDPVDESTGVRFLSQVSRWGEHSDQF